LIDTAAFCPCALLWAATGSPTIDPGLQGILVCLIIYKTVQFINGHLLQIAVASDTDPLYADSQHRNIMLAEGKVSFRTCLRSAHLPGTHILRLAHSSYPSLSAGGEPQTFVQAFDHWLLCEILAAIGGHSML